MPILVKHPEDERLPHTKGWGRIDVFMYGSLFDYVDLWLQYPYVGIPGYGLNIDDTRDLSAGASRAVFLKRGYVYP